LILLKIVRRPDDKLLAFLLGTAIGVMITLSIVEMWLHNALEHGWTGVTGSLMCGALLYVVVQPFLPDFQAVGKDQSSSETRVYPSEQHPKLGTKVARLRSAELLRLGLLMAFTMTLHNLPEGFAVAFSAFTDVGPIMAAAIAVHNIPEGIVVAAPVYAATGSRWKALAIATVSGLSEPVGALLALLSVKPLLSEDSLHYILAFAGGIMTAVCVVELWPEGRKCRADDKLMIGIGVGAVVMAWTLWVGV
jgi:ZIP family zinc transporter